MGEYETIRLAGLMIIFSVLALTIIGAVGPASDTAASRSSQPLLARQASNQARTQVGLSAACSHWAEPALPPPEFSPVLPGRSSFSRVASKLPRWSSEEFREGFNQRLW